MEKLKDVTFFFVPFLTLCGALYHIAYWSTFGLNGLEFITLGDIIKSSIYPILSSVALLIIMTIFGAYSPLYKIFPHGEGRETPVGKKLNSNTGVIILTILWVAFMYFILTFGKLPDRWILFGTIAGIPIAIKSATVLLIQEFIQNIKLRVIFCQTITYLTIFAFTTGKKNSEEVLLNIKYKYTTGKYIEDVSTPSDTLKLLGTTDKFFIFSDLNNSKITFIESDNITLLQKK